MKAQFIDRTLSQPFNIARQRGRRILGQMVHTLLHNERPATDITGDPLPVMQIVGNVAVIPISGLLMLNVPDWIKAWGFNLTDANDIEIEVERALNHPQVELIVQAHDSPGGQSLAGDKLFAIFSAALQRKPVFAWCGDGEECCSSSYESAAASLAMLAAPQAIVGCIGTYMTVLDDTEFWAQMGIKWSCLRSGDLKGMGEDGYSDEQLAWLQSVVDQFGAQFRANVRQFRSGIADEDMQGQWFVGEQAAAHGFTAGTAKNLSEAIARFQQMIARR